MANRAQDNHAAKAHYGAEVLSPLELAVARAIGVCSPLRQDVLPQAASEAVTDLELVELALRDTAQGHLIRSLRANLDRVAEYSVEVLSDEVADRVLGEVCSALEANTATIEDVSAAASCVVDGVRARLELARTLADVERWEALRNEPPAPLIYAETWDEYEAEVLRRAEASGKPLSVREELAE